MKKILELEGFRGILACWVMIFHIFSISDTIKYFPKNIAQIIDGENAVNVFIILSGFVISMLITSQNEDYKLYIIRRFFRLYPIYIICILIALLLNVIGIIPQKFNSSELASHLILHATMLHGIIPYNILPHASGAILNPAWSISLEWQFYLIAPLIFFITKKYRKTGLLIVVLTFIILSKAANHYGNWDGAFLLSKIQFFLLGMFSLFIYKWLVTTSKENLKKIAAYSIPFMCLIFFTFCPFVKHFSIILWISFSLMILDSSRVDSKVGSIFSGIMNNNLLQWLGKISYSIYLIHEIIIWCSVKLLNTAFNNLSTSQKLFYITLITIPTTLLLSNFSYKYIEKPTINFSKKLK